jgi:hypothetical protein
MVYYLRSSMLEISVLVERVEGARLSEKANENTLSNYGLNVNMAERDRNPESLVLSFTLELTSQPQLARLAVTGIATVTGNKEEIRNAITAPDDDHPPLVLETIYERIYGLLYLLSSNLKIPHPKPQLLKSAGNDVKK